MECLLWVKQPSAERAQRGASAGTEHMWGAEEQEACVWSCGLSLLLWGWGADSTLPPFAFLRCRGEMQAHGSAMAPGASLVVSWPQGVRWGDSFVPVSVSGTPQSLGSQ